MFSTPFLDWSISEVKTNGGAATSPATRSVHLFGLGRHCDLHHVFAVRRSHITKREGRKILVVVSATTHSEKQCRQSRVRRMLKALGANPNVAYPSGSLVSHYFTGPGSVRSRGRVAVDYLCKSAATSSEQVMYTPSIIMPCSSKNSRSRKRFRIEIGCLWAPQVLNLDRLRDCNSHHT